jgi:acetyltransferase-like isoleucine patch superfamily enzyme
MIHESRVCDRACYRNRGGLFQRLTSAYKSWRYLTKCGENVVIKRSCEFRLATGAILEVGSGSTLQDGAFFQLTLPSPKVYIGCNAFIGRRNIITSKNLVRIGDNVLIGSDVQVIDHERGMAREDLIRDQPARIGQFVIEDDCWIGARAKILVNTTIGSGAVIGANAVVTSDIPSCAVALGVPARVIKYRI